jgi:hypothetical protein
MNLIVARKGDSFVDSKRDCQFFKEFLMSVCW